MLFVSRVGYLESIQGVNNESKLSSDSSSEAEAGRRRLGLFDLVYMHRSVGQNKEADRALPVT